MKSFRNNVAIIIPVYNEVEVVRRVVESALDHYNYVVCVDDGSRDGSALEVSKTNAYLIKHPINMGQGAALQTGIEFACSLPVDYFVTYDADGQHRLEDIKGMLEVLSGGNYDVVLGSRFLGRVIGIKKSRKVMLRCAVWFTNLVTRMKLTDTHNGLRAFNRVVAQNMEITVPDMAHASQILEIIARHGYRYTEQPVTIEYTSYSKSKGQTLINAINIGFDTLLRKITK